LEKRISPTMAETAEFGKKTQGILGVKTNPLPSTITSIIIYSFQRD
jgi:hypothetical protein